jgi:hypothetical protein
VKIRGRNEFEVLYRFRYVSQAPPCYLEIELLYFIVALGDFRSCECVVCEGRWIVRVEVYVNGF